MSTIILWNEEKKRHEKWIIKRDGIDVRELELGGEE